MVRPEEEAAVVVDELVAVGLRGDDLERNRVADRVGLVVDGREHRRGTVSVTAQSQVCAASAPRLSATTMVGV